jgi:hypothetical protein
VDARGRSGNAVSFLDASAAEDAPHDLGTKAFSLACREWTTEGMWVGGSVSESTTQFPQRLTRQLCRRIDLEVIRGVSMDRDRLSASQPGESGAAAHSVPRLRYLSGTPDTNPYSVEVF